MPLSGFSSGFSLGFGAAPGTFRFLADHYVNGEIIQAGETRLMSFLSWEPTPDVDPLDTPAVQAFYHMGPQLGARIVSQWTGRVVAPPVTYWQQTEPNFWGLTGLGIGYAPVRAIIGRL